MPVIHLDHPTATVLPRRLSAGLAIATLTCTLLVSAVTVTPAAANEISIWHDFGAKKGVKVAIKAAPRPSTAPTKPIVASKPEPARPVPKPLAQKLDPKPEARPEPKVVVAAVTPPVQPAAPPLASATPQPATNQTGASASPLLAPDGVAPAASLKAAPKGAAGAAPKVAALAPPKASDTPSRSSPPSPPPSVTTRPPQFVLLAFDGSQSDEMWKATMGLADSLAKEGKPAKFTYFISGVYFLSEKTRKLYDAPGRSPGSSYIGFGSSKNNDIPQRIANVNAAHASGHEIASHANGHFDGKSWSEAMWRSEFRQFEDLVFNAAKNNELPDDEATGKPPALSMAKRSVVGFRAPMLGHSPGLWPTMAAHGFRYDTSRTAKPDYWPRKLPGSGWNFALGEIKVPGTGMRTLSMDYNFYVVQSGARPNPAQAARYEEQMYESYLGYFNANYLGNRAPVHIGHHFAQWNNGAYWRAFQRFARAVCGKPEVKCVTYRELADYLDNQPEPHIAAYQKGSFPRLADAQPVKTALGAPLDLDLALAPTAVDNTLSFTATGSDWHPTRYRVAFEIGDQAVATNVQPTLDLVRAAYPRGATGTFGWRLYDGDLEVLRLTHTITHLGTPAETISAKPLEAAALEGDLPEAHHADCDHPLAH